MRYLFFVGTAGSGKSTLVQAYKEWLDAADISSVIVNLEPGSDATPYEPDIDIRHWISLGEVMQQYNLGPNGAQVVAADLLTANIGRLTDALAMEDAKYALIDTPGQLELFAFRQSSIDLIEALGMDKSMIIYTADPMLCKTANGFISGEMLSMLVQFRLQVPIMNVLTKSDLLDDWTRERLIAWFEEPETLYENLLDEDRNPQNIVGMELFKTLENVGVFGQMRSVSAKEGEGMEEIYATSQLAFFGGEDPERD